MKKTINKITIFIVAVIVLIMWGCQNPVTHPLEPNSPSMGMLKISIGQKEQAKTILPTFDIDHFQITGTGPSGSNETFSMKLRDGNSSNISDLVTGTWTITVQGMNAANEILAGNSATIEIVQNTTAELDIPLSFLQDGFGDITVSLSWPQSIGINSVTAKWGANPAQEFYSEGNETIITLPGTAGGYYIFFIELKKDGNLYASVIEAVHVYNNQNSSSSICFQEGDFTTPPVFAPNNLSGYPSTSSGMFLNKVTLFWTDLAKTETHYVIERKEAHEANFTKIDEVISKYYITNQSYSDATALGEKTYIYRVIPKNAFGTAGPSNELTIITGGPVISKVYIPSGIYRAGEEIPVTLYTNGRGFTDYSSSLMGISAISSSFSDLGDGNYTMNFTVPTTVNYGALSEIPFQFRLRNSGLVGEFEGLLESNGTVMIDGSLPECSITFSDSNPDTSPFQAYLEFSEKITGLNLEDFTVSGGSATNLRQFSDTKYSVDLTPDYDPVTVYFTVKAESYQDLTGNSNPSASYKNVSYSSAASYGLIRQIIPSDDPQYMYAMDYYMRYIYKIDTVNETAVREVKLPYPYLTDMEYSAVDKKLYILPKEINKIIVYDVDTKEISEIDISDNAENRDLEIDPVTRRIYVTQLSSTLLVIDMDTNQTIKTCEDTDFSHYITYNPGTKQLYPHQGGSTAARSFSVANDSIQEVKNHGFFHQVPVSQLNMPLSKDGKHLMMGYTSYREANNYVLLDVDPDDVSSIKGQWKINQQHKAAFFSPDSNYLYCSINNAGGETDHLRIFDVENYIQVGAKSIPNYDYYDTVLGLNTDGTVLVSFTDEVFSFIRDIRPERTFPANPLGEISSITGIDNSTHFYASDVDFKSIIKLDPVTQDITERIRLPKPHPVAVEYSKTKNKLYIASKYDKNIMIYDLENRSFSYYPVSVSTTIEQIISLKIDDVKDRAYLLAHVHESRSFRVYSYNLNTGALVASQELFRDASPSYRTSIMPVMTYNADLEMIYLTYNGDFYSLPVAGDAIGDYSRLLTGHSSRYTAVSSDGGKLAYSKNGSIYIVDPQNVSEVNGTINAFDAYCLRFSPDGSLLYATASNDDPGLHVYNTATLEKVRTLDFNATNGNRRYFEISTTGSAIVGAIYDAVKFNSFELRYFTNIE